MRLLALPTVKRGGTSAYSTENSVGQGLCVASSPYMLFSLLA